MPTGAHIEIANDDLAQIVTSVFETMMGLEVFHCTDPASRFRPTPPLLVSAVHFSGDWDGILVVECGRSLALRLARRYLCLGDTSCCSPTGMAEEPPIPELWSDDSADADDVARDVLGEIANMIGGNLKSVLSLGLAISMPVVRPVVPEEGHGAWAPGYKRCNNLVFRSSEGVFAVTVVPH